MPVLASSTSASSPSRRLGLGTGSYASSSSYTSSYGSSYTRSSSVFSSGARTASLDRSPYTAYKYSSPSYTTTSGGNSSSSATRDYLSSSRPPISTRNTSSSSSFYSSLSSSSSRTSPSRSYFSRHKSTSDSSDPIGLTSSLLRGGRETQSEARDSINNGGSSSSSGSNSNNNYLSVSKRSRDYGAPSSSSSKYRTGGDRNGGSSLTNGGSTSTSTVRSRYSTERDTELPKISERIRTFQSSKSVEPAPVSNATPFKSRFLRSSAASSATTDSPSAAKSSDEPEEVRPSVSDLRRRYDLNRNHLTPDRSRASNREATPTLNSSSSSSKPSGSARRGSGDSDSDDSLSNSRVTHSTTTPDRLLNSNGERLRPKAFSKEPAPVHRSSSPASTLSSSSSEDGDSQDGQNGVTDRRSTAALSSNSIKLGNGGGGARGGSRLSINDAAASSSDAEASAVTSSPKLASRSRTYSSNQQQQQQQQAAAKTTTGAGVTSSESAGLVGLRNIGNTCFMNSVLQCLSNTRPVLEFVLSDEYAKHINTSISSMNGALIKAYAIVMSELWKKDEDDDDSYSSAVNPTALKSQIQKFAPRFMGYNQQDAQEFLRYLLEGLHEDVNRVAVKPKPLEHDIADSLSDSDRAVESWKRYLRRDDSKIVDLFVGQLKSTLQCTVCGHCSVTFDPFWDLSLPIPTSASKSTSNLRLQHCLDLFAKEEILDGDEKPTCSKCQTRRKCTKKFSIYKFPKILVLHLKRFSPGERFRKLDASVDFPLTDLDLSAYSSPGVRPSPCSYQLYGVINHSGSAYSGHYTASCRHPFTASWHEYNDARVSNLAAQRVVSSEAYLLFYELESHEARL